jgi:GTP-binding protein
MPCSGVRRLCTRAKKPSVLDRIYPPNAAEPHLSQGRTRVLNFFRVGVSPGKLILVDAPGYGARGRAEWGNLFGKYLETRQECVCISYSYHNLRSCLFDRLRRVYILFNAKHPLNDFDTQMLSHLSNTLISARGTQPFTLQSIITKADCIPIPQVSQVLEKMRKEIWEAAPLCLPPIITSAAMSPPFGVDEVRQNIVEACRLSLLRPPKHSIPSDHRSN